jgi:hypothetical protein
MMEIKFCAQGSWWGGYKNWKLGIYQYEWKQHANPDSRLPILSFVIPEDICKETRWQRSRSDFNPLAPEFFWLILAHPVCKM